MKYYCKFDEQGKRMESIPDILADDYGGRDKLAADYILVSDEDYQYYIGNKGTGANGTGYIRDTVTGKPIDAPARTATIQEKLQCVKKKYQEQLDRLSDAKIKADLADNVQLVDSIKQSYKILNTKLNTEIEETLKNGK